jgi:hypothetical protein
MEFTVIVGLTHKGVKLLFQEFRRRFSEVINLAAKLDNFDRDA